jgi:tRNA-binding protein
MKEIRWQDFEKLELRVGTILSAEAFAEAIKPAYQLTIDFGKEIGVNKSSVRITDLYSLVDKQIIGVVNFPAKKIGPFMCECLVTGLIQEDASVVLAVPDKPASNGSRLAK